MKKLAVTLAFIGWVIMLAACGSGAAETTARTEQETPAAQTKPAGTVPAETRTEDYSSDPGVDVLITPNNLAFNKVADLLEHPKESRGKIIQMIGEFDAYYIENTGYLYIACEVPDPSTCCVPGIEFELGPSYTYPDDYPEVGTVITVKGEFDTYERDGATFGILRNAEMK